MLASYADLLLLICFLLRHFCGVAAIPTHKHIPHNATVSSTNETALQEMEDIEKPWTPSPRRRGTNDLLLSCAVTIVLAVWSSILVNIQMSPDATLPRPKYARSKTDIDAEQPGYQRGKAKKSTGRQILGFCTFALKTLGLALDPRHRVRWKYKALWAFLNVMLPELALAVALDEWRKSRDLMKALHNLERDKDKDKDKYTPLFAKWNMTMCFYAVMGGFYVPELPYKTPPAIGSSTRQPTPGMSDGDQKSIRTLADDTMPIPIEGQNEYCNWSLVKRCCDVSEKRIKHRNFKSDMSRKERRKKKKDLDEMKPRYVLTTHGVVYMARLLKDMQVCAERHRTEPGYTGATCDFRDPIKEACNCPQHAKILENQFRDITPEIIDDLSKSDWMGRVFFLVQSGWMIIQTMARYFSHLPITLLELHAALHVAVAALQYIIWWFKPIDMVVMTPLSFPHRNFKICETEDLTNHHFLDSDLPKLVSNTSSEMRNTATSTSATSTSPRQHRHTQSQFQGHDPAAITQQHTPAQSSQGPPAQEGDQLLADVDDAQVPHGRQPGGLTTRIQEWWSGLLEIENRGDYSKAYFTSQSTLGKEGSKQIAGISIPHHPLHGIVLAIVRLTLSWQRWPFKALIWFCTCLSYSIAHLAAWHWHFPTDIEKVAWHWCTSFTTASLVVLSILGLLASLYRFLRLWGFWWRKGTQKKNILTDMGNILADIVCSDFLRGVYEHGVRLTGLSIAIGVTPWLLARLYIFVESVISIRSVPKETYDTVKWTEFIPHI